MSMPFPATVRGRRLLPLPYHPNRSSSKRRSSRLARSQGQASRGPRPPRGRRAQREPPRRSFHGGAHRRSSPGTSPSTPPPTGTGMPPLHPRPPWSTIQWPRSLSVRSRTSARPDARAGGGRQRDRSECSDSVDSPWLSPHFCRVDAADHRSEPPFSADPDTAFACPRITTAERPAAFLAGRPRKL
jgi:hypothetical protein